MIPIIVGQDGSIINNEATFFPLLPSDKRYSKKDKQEIFDFVGFVIYKEKMLAVFPKHFYDFDECDNVLEDIKLLFNIIRKYTSENKNMLLTDKYFGYENNFESDYPFAEFYKIYEYYKKYGIYKEEQLIIEKSLKGRISWKDTISKSDVIVSNDNLIFLPIYSKRKSSRDAFISECMTYVINYTINKFPFFIDFPPITSVKSKIDFLANREYTLRQLYQYENKVFKDYQKELIKSLISFFEKFDNRSTSGAIHIKINYFDMIWQKMVNKYLNDCFVKVDEEHRKLEFEYDKSKKHFSFNSKKFDIDVSEHKYYIIPDHYYNDETSIYLFDSKYYQEISDLNYKQFSYTILLGNSQLGNSKKLYSALLLPGKKPNGIHLQLDIPYCQMNPGCNYIIEQYLDVKLIMKNYLNLKDAK